MNNLINLTELSALGIIRVAGADAEKFLQGQLTCDVREVTEGQSRLGAHCDHKGRMQAVFRCLKYKEDYYLVLAKDLLPHLLQCLRKYAMFSKVELNDDSAAWQQLGLSGAALYTALQGLLAGELTGKTDAVLCRDRLMVVQPLSNLPRLHLLGSPAALAPLEQALSSQVQITDFAAWRLLDIDAGLPSLALETIGLFTPHQLNLPALNGVSFNKGCYTGQEIVARMQYLGKLKQQMYKITFKALHAIAPGAKIKSDDAAHAAECGTLVEAVQIDTETWQGLAVVNSAHSGQALYCEKPQQTVLDLQELQYTQGH